MNNPNLPIRMPSSLTQAAMKNRTRQFALSVIRLVQLLTDSPVARHLAFQLLRSATSVAANYRAACRSRSRKEFIAKIGLVIEESDEALFWIELIAESRLARVPDLDRLADEANQLVAIFVATRCTARQLRPARNQGKA